MFLHKLVAFLFTIERCSSFMLSSNIWVISSSVVGFKELISEQLSKFTDILLESLDSIEPKSSK